MRAANPLNASMDATPLPATVSRVLPAGSTPHKGNAKKPRGKHEQATEEQAAQSVSEDLAAQDEQHTSAEHTAWADDVLLAQADTEVAGDEGGASAAGMGSEQTPAVAGLSNTALLVGGVGVVGAAAASGGSSSPAPAPATDTTPPQLNITMAGTPQHGQTVVFTFKFNEDVTGFAANRIELSGGTAGNFVAVDARTYTLEVTVGFSGQPVTVGVDPGAASDLAGNAYAEGQEFETSTIAPPEQPPASDTTAPTFTAGATVGVDFAENGTNTVHNAAATDNVGVVAYAFADGGADNDKFNLNTATGALTFKAAPDFEAPGSAAGSNAYTVKVKALDAAGNEAVQTVTVNVTNVNEAPVNTVPNAQTVDRDSVRYITGLSVTDADPGATVSVRLSVSHGTLLVAGAGGVVQSGTGTGDNITLTGTLADVNAALAAPNAVAYRGNLAYVGADTLVMHTTDGGSPVLSDTDSVAITVNNFVIDSATAFDMWQEAETAWVEQTTNGSTTHNIEFLNQFSGIITATRDTTSRDGSANQTDPAKRLTEWVDQVTGTDIVSAAEFNAGFTLTGKAAAGQAGTIKFWLDKDRTDGVNEVGVQLQHGQDGVSIAYDNATGEYSIQFAPNSTALQQATHNTWGSGVHQITVDSDGNGAKNGSEASRLFLVASGTAHFTDTGLVSQNYSVQDRVSGDLFVYYYGDPDGDGVGAWTELDNGDSMLNQGLVLTDRDGDAPGFGDFDYYASNLPSGTGSTAANTAMHFVTDIKAQVWEFHMARYPDHVATNATNWSPANEAAVNHSLWGSNSSRLPSLAEVVAVYAANFGGDSAGGNTTEARTVGAIQPMSDAGSTNDYVANEHNQPAMDWDNSLWSAGVSPTGHLMVDIYHGNLLDVSASKIELPYIVAAVL